MPKTTPKAARRQPVGTARRGADLAGLTESIRALLTVAGVDGVGRPVTRISPGDLPPDLLGFVERLRGGAIDGDEEMLLLTLPGVPRRPRRGDPVAHRLRLAFALLCDYATEHGVSADALAALLAAAAGAGHSSPPGG